MMHEGAILCKRRQLEFARPWWHLSIMKAKAGLILAVSMGIAAGAAALTPEEAVKRITWNWQNALRIELAGKIVWIDPTWADGTEKADLILLTHTHSDHFSAATVAMLTGPNTTVLAAFDREGFARIKPGESRQFGDLKVEAAPAYNIKKASNHPKASGWCGFILSGEGVRIYDAGDTELIPEMKSITCDIALLPLGQTYTMSSVEDAVQAALDVKAKIAIPVHFGLYEGTNADADAFIAALAAKGVKAVRLPAPPK
jgi:L-ascorbate metabolism protein UlaG (beta-lactamase superfamily)